MFTGNDGFLEKNSAGVMAKYCQRCHQHLDLHGFRRGVGAGNSSIRSCPDVAPLASSRSSQLGSEHHTPVVERPPDVHFYTPSPSSTAPFGTDNTSATHRSDSYVRVRKVGELTPANHLEGTSCTVVLDENADNFIPLHIAGKAPHDNLHGAAAQSNFNELDAWKRPGSKVHPSQVSQMTGGGLVPR
ncbi:Hypothetical protein, putative [Bodo saltans]|uniref:Uncharacterized protein n=1 Tax=Bodo saltans TaxID=75058 RepID=A0A0S4IV25_BODSA|nr:Hypothetical protein, putative [Bodo saltans]|eukprot:CUF99504.1 Hypothetical protein, putative [Bodo saltans]